MKIKQQYKVREMAGENVVIMHGKLGVDLTRIISLNHSALHLWNTLYDREFDVDAIINLLVDEYGIDRGRAANDAQQWIDRLKECGLVE